MAGRTRWRRWPLSRCPPRCLWRGTGRPRGKDRHWIVASFLLDECTGGAAKGSAAHWGGVDGDDRSDIVGSAASGGDGSGGAAMLVTTGVTSFCSSILAKVTAGGVAVKASGLVEHSLLLALLLSSSKTPSIFSSISIMRPSMSLIVTKLKPSLPDMVEGAMIGSDTKCCGCWLGTGPRTEGRALALI